MLVCMLLQLESADVLSNQDPIRAATQDCTCLTLGEDTYSLERLDGFPPGLYKNVSRCSRMTGKTSTQIFKNPSSSCRLTCSFS